VIIKQCLPLFGKICSSYAGDAEVTDTVCAVLKQGVTTLQAGAASYSSSALVFIFKDSPVSVT
jgi:hypothetical protein